MSEIGLLIVEPARRDSILLSDGRRLAWSEWGEETARPVLFCTGAAMSGSLGFGFAALRDCGLRLLSIDRPGLGTSDPHANKTLTTWAADMREVIAARSLRRPLAVGFSQGAPFAFALAAEGLVTALAVVAGQDELAHPALRDKLEPEVAAMVAAAAGDPSGLIRGFEQIANVEAFWQMVMAMSAASDRAVYKSPGFAAAYRRCLEEGFAQGSAGYLRDLVIALQPWPFALEAIEQPVDLWYGALDTSPVHAPDGGRGLAERLSRATLTIDPAQGAALLWTRTRDILARLCSHP
ncbi:alpha/beta hydrolase [Pelagibius sp.]|uniref:alpha/beta hydrolase n=1 Tax=Pelagibius sp. TaxID=1931238 RepID=UPI002630C5C6|nr:alpha/beta fold hydrolase [Pelagibius sp.]